MDATLHEDVQRSVIQDSCRSSCHLHSDHCNVQLVLKYNWEPTQPPIQWVLGALLLGLKRPSREADHSPPSSAEMKNAWNYTSTPQYALKASCSVKKKHRDNFTFYVATMYVPSNNYMEQGPS
jgi:hypothetical protein